MNNVAWGRPTDILEMPDGSLLIADDHANVIYRLTYETP
jgi:glucose/arabinose dehydrogenase